eukprot:GHVR01003399.1.p1 GENE.GHVR01003399.1~~GHVR01003399.1.p1  ORF type:complete len:402 (+),score=46.10 GHVR01003399.1:685-1890(+)
MVHSAPTVTPCNQPLLERENTMNLKELRSSALPAALASQTTLIIKGGPGMGKTEATYGFAADMSSKTGMPFGLVTAIISGMDPVDLRGVFIPMKADDGSAIVRATKPAIWPSAYNVDIFVDGKKLNKAETRSHIKEHGMPDQGTLFIDEFSQADTDLQKVAAQIMLDRRIGEHVLPDGWSVVAAGNRTEDRAGVVKTLSHVQNRMCEINVEPDYEAWQDWAFKNEVHPLTIGFAKSNAGEVFRQSVPKEQGPYCTPRSLVLCTKVLMSMKPKGMSENQLPDDHIAAEIIKGWMGEGVLPKFISHIRLANDLPEVEDIIKNPTTTKVPDRLDARFVMCTSLAVHAKDAKKTRPILAYIERMDVELQTLFVQGVVARNPQALAVREFGQWVQRNQKLILAANG